MICPRCQTPHPEGYTVCTVCGTPLAQPTLHPVVAAVKEVAGSTLSLVAAVLFSALLVLSLIQSFTATSLLADVVNDTGLQATVSTGETNIFGILLGAAPSLLLVIGAWMVWASARQPETLSVKSAGFTLMKVSTVIMLVLMCIAFPIGAIVLIAGGSAVSDIPLASEASSTMSLVGILLLAIGAVVIVFYSLAVRAINGARQAGVYGDPTKVPSAFVGVCCYIAAGLMVMAAIDALIDFGSYSFLTALSYLGNAAMLVVCGMLLFRLRKALKPHAENAQMAAPYAPGYPPVYQPMPQQPVYAPAPVAQPPYAAPTAPVAPEAPAAPAANTTDHTSV